jgi:DNA mismatch repair protein MutS
MEDSNSPMMKQYLEIKKQYQDCLLFYRMGDFYELFMDDAHTGAKVLDITLTSKYAGKNTKVPMAGVPYHAVDSYLAKLVKAGYKVAICEQVSEPTKYGLVDREVIRIVTPGTVFDEKTLEKKENNYIICVVFKENSLGIAAADVSTGQFFAHEMTGNGKEQMLIDELARLKPSECILSEKDYNNPHVLRLLKTQKDINIYPFFDAEYFLRNDKTVLKKHFRLSSLASFEVADKPQALQASAVLIGYLKHTQKDKIDHIKKILPLLNKSYMNLDKSTIINLEIFSTLRDQEKQGSLIHLVDETITAMGGRMLREWIRKPLVNKKEIEKRHDAVEHFVKKRAEREKLRIALEMVSDIERLLSRLTVGIGNARDLINLKNSLKNIEEIKTFLSSKNVSLMKEITSNIPTSIQKINKIIEKNIVEEPPIELKEGGIIKTGVHNELDLLKEKVVTYKKWIENFEIEEKERTGITTLKVKFNQVFGFYIEISKSYLSLVPKNYLRKQTLVNGERFITLELKEKEEFILTAEEKMNKIEFEIYSEVLKKVLEYTQVIQDAAHSIAMLDCILNFSAISEKYHYSKPVITENGTIDIQAARHAVVETMLEDEQFVPNDVLLNHKNNQLLIITGPNMAGKSVYIRQVALIVLLAQVGCFVPAGSAKISVADRIFVRSGASDVITSGLSTFMVEMTETAQILHNATEKSLIVMDEIGRGTSTYDGISIAWAVAEYLANHQKIGPKTLFATHYHELQMLENEFPSKIKNYHMAIEEHKGLPIFLHTILPGGASHSFGVAVAQLAGVPEQVTEKAHKKLFELEKRDGKKEEAVSIAEKNKVGKFYNKVIKNLEQVNIQNTTPLQALNILSDLKKEVKKNE